MNGKLQNAWKRLKKSKPKEENMAEAKKDGQEKDTAGAKPVEKAQSKQMGIRLAPGDRASARK